MRAVAVVGPGDADEATCTIARDVGRALAERGITVLTGGLGGVMAAAAQGARDGGGQAIGLLPGDDRTTGSPAHTALVPTGLGEVRNAMLVREADGVIAVGGSWGTLSEIALARRTGVPVVCIGGWTVLDQSGAEVVLERADSAQEAISRLAVLIGRMDG